MAGITVKKNEQNPEKTEVLAESIIRIGEAFQKLKDTGLNERGIVVLIQDATRVSKRDITAVLDALRLLRSWYCRD